MIVCGDWTKISLSIGSRTGTRDERVCDLPVCRKQICVIVFIHESCRVGYPHPNDYGGIPPSHAIHVSPLFMRPEGVPVFFFSRGTPLPPSRHLEMGGTPLQGTPGWGYTPFSGMGFTSESTFFVCSVLVPGPHPPPIFWGGGCRSGAPDGWGYPTFASPVNDRYPRHSTQRTPQSSTIFPLI